MNETDQKTAIKNSDIQTAENQNQIFEKISLNEKLTDEDVEIIKIVQKNTRKNSKKKKKNLHALISNSLSESIKEIGIYSPEMPKRISERLPLLTQKKNQKEFPKEIIKNKPEIYKTIFTKQKRQESEVQKNDNNGLFDFLETTLSLKRVKTDLKTSLKKTAFRNTPFSEIKFKVEEKEIPIKRQIIFLDETDSETNSPKTLPIFTHNCCQRFSSFEEYIIYRFSKDCSEKQWVENCRETLAFKRSPAAIKLRCKILNKLDESEMNKLIDFVEFDSKRAIRTFVRRKYQGRKILGFQNFNKEINFSIPKILKTCKKLGIFLPEKKKNKSEESSDDDIYEVIFYSGRKKNKAESENKAEQNEFVENNFEGQEKKVDDKKDEIKYLSCRGMEKITERTSEGKL